MKLTKTPAQQHDYNIKLTKGELLALMNQTGSIIECLNAQTELSRILKREVERLGEQQGSAGQAESADRS